MSPEQLDSLANDIEDNLKKDLVLVKGFCSDGLQDDRRAKTVLAVKILCLLNIARFFILGFLCLFSSSKTSTNFSVIFVDTFFPFGSFGRLGNEICVLGFTSALSFSHVMHEAEKNGQLQVISYIKDHREFKLTPVETMKFARYLQWMKNIRSLFMYGTLPSLILFFTVGAYLSSLKVQSMTFAAASIFVTLINSTQLYFGCVWSNYAYLIPVHSNNVFTIQFNRLFERIENLQRAQNLIDRNLKLESETSDQKVSLKTHQWVQLAQQQVKERHEIIKASENLLRQIDQHNETVKHILDKGIRYLVPMYGLVIVFFAGERGNLLRHTFSGGLGLGALIFYISLLKTRDVYTLSLRLSSNLHSLQARQRGKGIKSQLQILRLIKRTSDCESWHHSIGFTVENWGSLSSKLVLSSFFQTMTIALTFLNVKSAWKQ